MSEEEKKAIEDLKKEYKKMLEENNILFPLYKTETKKIIDLIEKQDKMIDLMAETMALDIMYADEDKDVQAMKEKIKESYRKEVEKGEKSSTK